MKRYGGYGGNGSNNAETSDDDDDNPTGVTNLTNEQIIQMLNSTLPSKYDCYVYWKKHCKLFNIFRYLYKV